MTTRRDYIRHGVGCMRPYLHGPRDLPAFLVAVFGAVELERHAFGAESFHVELQVDDAVVVVEAGDLPLGIEPWVGSIYVYVEDVDGVYKRAIEHGAVSVAAPEDKPYDERQAGFLDAGGNTWWVASYRGVAR